MAACTGPRMTPLALIPTTANGTDPSILCAGSGSQDDLMLKDECILVDEGDRVIGHASKAAAHRFESASQPKGLLHRAFSVFLFDEKGACAAVLPGAGTGVVLGA